MSRTPKTDNELRKLALEYVGGSIFTDRHIHESEHEHMVFSVFMPLMFIQGTELEKNPPALVYEHLSKASDRGINGYPVFLSCQYLTEDELKRFAAFVKQLEAFVKQLEAFEQKGAVATQPQDAENPSSA